MNKVMPEASVDKRAQRTRQALLAAFFGLVLERRYSEIKVGDIIERAQVGRSTFYEHFANKHAILACSLEQPFSALADAVMPTDNTPRLVLLLQHLGENRALGNALLAGTMRRRVSAVLVKMIERRLDQERLTYPHAILIPARLAAIQLAESLLAPVAAWLAGASACTPELLARVLRLTTMGIVDALRRSNESGARH